MTDDEVRPDDDEWLLQELDEPSVDLDADIEVRHDDTAQRYAASIAGRELAEIRYEDAGDHLVIQRTHVVPEARGRGIATQLVAYVLDDIRGRGRRIVIRCPLVTAFIRDNDEYADLVAHPA